MRFESLRAWGLGPFHGSPDREVAIDFDALPGPIVAVVGANGAGKTTLLELLAGALTRECPTRGPLAGLARGRDAFVEVTVVNGQRYTIRQLVDAIARKGEAVVLDAAGAPVLESTKLTSYDRWAAAHLPSPDVLYASTFGVQGSGGFLALRPAERKAVLLRALGIERYERLAEAARERAREAKAHLATIDALLAEARGSSGAVDDAERELARAIEEREASTAALTTARAALDAAREEYARADERRRNEEAVRHQRAAAEAELSRVEREIAEVDARIRRDRGVLDDADAIREMAARRAALESDLAATREEYARATAEHESAARRERELDEAARTVARDVAAADARHRALSVDAGLRAEVDAADVEVARLQAKLAELEALVEEKRTDLERVRALRMSGAADRIEGLTGGLQQIVTGAEPVPTAIATLREDDARAARLEDAPRRIALLEGLIRDGQGQGKLVRGQLEDARAIAGRRATVEAAESALADAAAQLDDAIARHEGASSLLDEARRIAARTLQAHRDIAARGARLRREYDELSKDTRSRELELAEARAPELDRQLASLRERAEAIEERLAMLPTAEAVEIVDLTEARRAVEGAERAARTTHEAVARSEQALERARATDTRVGELSVAQACHDVDLQDWTRLAQDLGRDGLQALEIDAAGPELTVSINDLLHTCVSTRWTVTIETTRPSADGKRQIEGLDVRVLDTVAGRDAPVETYSGGERVLLGEAVSLGLAMLSTRRAGLDGVTLVRDESGAALDPTNARSYVAMLRRAAELVRAHRVLLVSHSPDVQELCDSRLVVADGRVEVQA
jgi:DNA repair protein SbcC/Rad50